MSDFAGHTPGPWVQFLDENVIEILPAMRDWAIASLPLFESDAYANAALIAAAPTLLAQRDALAEALRGLEAAGDRVYHDLEQRIRAASASAVPVFDGLADLHDAINRARTALETEK